jgi:hypothetical protein
MSEETICLYKTIVRYNNIFDPENDETYDKTCVNYISHVDGKEDPTSIGASFNTLPYVFFRAYGPDAQYKRGRPEGVPEEVEGTVGELYRILATALHEMIMLTPESKNTRVTLHNLPFTEKDFECIMRGIDEEKAKGGE